MKDRILGVIPARGGSKRLPEKNVLPVFGKPLIAWTIEAARRSRLLTDFMVSTEDSKIKKIAENYGAKVLVRPKELASDESTTLEVLRHIIRHEPADAVVLLQCTCPIRSKGLIDRCIRKFLASDADCLATGRTINEGKWGTYNVNPRNYLSKTKKNGYFHDDGNIYIFKSKIIKENRLYTDNNIKIISPREESIDINDEFDLWVAEQIFRKKAQNEK